MMPLAGIGGFLPALSLPGLLAAVSQRIDSVAVGCARVVINCAAAVVVVVVVAAALEVVAAAADATEDAGRAVVVVPAVAFA